MVYSVIHRSPDPKSLLISNPAGCLDDGCAELANYFCPGSVHWTEDTRRRRRRHRFRVPCSDRRTRKPSSAGSTQCESLAPPLVTSLHDVVSKFATKFYGFRIRRAVLFRVVASRRKCCGGDHEFHAKKRTLNFDGRRPFSRSAGPINHSGPRSTIAIRAPQSTKVSGGNEKYAKDFDPPLVRRSQPRLAIVPCVDPRAVPSPEFKR